MTSYVNKYLATVVGFGLVVLPVYNNTQGMSAQTTPAQIAEYYVVSRQIMEGLADAVLRMFELQNQVGTLSGYSVFSCNLFSIFVLTRFFLRLTSRVFNLFKTLKHPEVLDLPSDPNNPPKFVTSDTLKFDKVTVYRPDGALLIKELSLEVKPGDRIIVTGENGCGKSSLFRVLRGLWPLPAGTLSKPGSKDFYFLSQVDPELPQNLRICRPDNRACAGFRSTSFLLERSGRSSFTLRRCQICRPGEKLTTTFGNASSGLT